MSTTTPEARAVTWHTKTVPTYRFVLLLSMIREKGGTVTSCERDGDGIRVTWRTRKRRPRRAPAST